MKTARWTLVATLALVSPAWAGQGNAYFPSEPPAAAQPSEEGRQPAYSLTGDQPAVAGESASGERERRRTRELHVPGNGTRRSITVQRP